MSSIHTILQSAIHELDKAGVDNPRLDAELLLAFVLGKSRSWLWTYPEYEVPEEDLRAFVSLLARRVAREPLAYLLGEREFYGRSFLVTPDVLIPRPETELLVEEAIRWLCDTHDALAIDVGTGSGCIAVTLAAELRSLRVIAVDVSMPALGVARLNAERHQVAQQVRFVHGDLLAPVVDLSRQADAIVANLPYIAEEERATLMPEVRDFEPQRALFAENAGLALIHTLIEQAPHVLRHGGLLALEVGMGQAVPVADYLGAHGWKMVHIIQDYAGIDRHVFAERG